MTRVKHLLAALTASVFLVGMTAAPAAAQVEQDGLVNVNIGDITIEDVNVAVAALIAANVCGVNVGPVILLAQEVDATGTAEAVCEIGRGGRAPGITITQN